MVGFAAEVNNSSDHCTIKPIGNISNLPIKRVNRQTFIEAKRITIRKVLLAVKRLKTELIYQVSFTCTFVQTLSNKLHEFALEWTLYGVILLLVINKLC